MLTKNHRQETMSRAFIHAIAGRCGMMCVYREFDYGIDVTVHEIRSRGGRLIESGFRIDFQAKSSTTAAVEEEAIVYDLEAKNYNDLCDPDVGMPRVLVLLVLPQNEAEWSTLTEESLIVRRCAYWVSLKGREPTENERTVRIRIPRTNVFSVEALTELMRRTRLGETL